jgi:hypothetical protein
MTRSSATTDAEILFQRFWQDRRLLLTCLPPEQIARAAFNSAIMAAAGLLIGAVPTNAFGDKHGDRPTDRQDD